jgi:O-antigen ligase
MDTAYIYKGINSIDSGGVTTKLIAVLLFISPFLRGLFFEKELLYIILYILFTGILYLLTSKTNNKINIYTQTTDIFFLACVCLYMLSVFYAVNKRLAILEGLKYISYFIIYITVSNLHKDTQNTRYRKNLLRVLIITSIAMSIVAIGGYIGTFNFKGAVVNGRLNSTFGYANVFATYTGVNVLLILGLSLIETKRVWKYIYGFAVNVVLVGFILTFSRGMWVLLPMALLALLLIIPKKHKLKCSVFIFISTICSILTSYIIINFSGSNSMVSWLSLFCISFIVAICFAYIEKLSNFKVILILLATIILVSLFIYPNIETNKITNRIISISFKSKTLQERLVFVRDGFNIIKGNFLFGTGGEGWQTLFKQHRSYDYFVLHPHNYFLQVVIEVGVLGFLCLFSFFIFFFYYFIKEFRNSNDEFHMITMGSLGIGIILILIHSAIDINLTFGAMSIMLWVLIGLGASYINNKKVITLHISKLLIVTIFLIMIPVSIITATFFSKLALNVSVSSNTIETIDISKLDCALGYINVSTKLDPYNIDYRITKATLYRLKFLKNDNAEDLERAIDTYDNSINLIKYSPEESVGAAKFYLSVLDLERALELAKQATDLDPLNMDIYLEKTNIYLNIIKLLLNRRMTEEAGYIIKDAHNIKDELAMAKTKLTKSFKNNRELESNLEAIEKLFLEYIQNPWENHEEAMKGNLFQ